MTQESLDEQLDISIEAFSVVPKMPAELVENLVSQGFFTFDDLSVIEPDELMEMSGMSQEDVDEVIAFADVESERIEQEEIARKLNPPPPPAPKPKAQPATEVEADAEGPAGAAVEETEDAATTELQEPTEEIEHVDTVEDQETEKAD